MGLARTYTLLYPEQIIMDNDIYQRARHSLMSLEVNVDELALDVIRAVGPGGHFLAQKHTRRHMPTALKRAITHQLGVDGKYLDPHEVARNQVKWILENHQPEPLDEARRAELLRILAAAGREIS